MSLSPGQMRLVAFEQSQRANAFTGADTALLSARQSVFEGQAMGFHHRDFDEEPARDPVQKAIRICSLVDYSGLSGAQAVASVVSNRDMLAGVVKAGLKAEARGGWPSPYGSMLNAPFQWPPT